MIRAKIPRATGYSKICLIQVPDARYHVDPFSLHLDQIACRACRVHGPANKMANVDPLVITRSEQQINLKATLYLKKTSNKKGMLRFTGKQETREPLSLEVSVERTNSHLINAESNSFPVSH